MPSLPVVWLLLRTQREPHPRRRGKQEASLPPKNTHRGSRRAGPWASVRGAWIGRLVWLALHSHTRLPGAGVSPFAFGICSPSSRSSVRCEPASPRPEGPHCAGLPGASFSLTCYPTQPLARCVADGGQGPAAPSLALCLCLPVLLAASHLLPALFLWSCAQIVLSWSWCSDFSVLMSCIYLFLNMQTYILL